MSRLRPGMARVEFYAIWNEVSELLDQGHTYRSAFDLLSEKKKITMKYDSFRRHIKSKFVKKEYAEIDNQEKSVVSSANNIKKIVPDTPPVQAFDQKNAVPLSDLLTGE